MKLLDYTYALQFDLEGHLNEQCSIEGYKKQRQVKEEEHRAKCTNGAPLARSLQECDIIFARKILTLMWQLRKDESIMIDRDWRKNVSVDQLEGLFPRSGYCEDRFACASPAPLWPCSTYVRTPRPSPPRPRPTFAPAFSFSTPPPLRGPRPPPLPVPSLPPSSPPAVFFAIYETGD